MKPTPEQQALLNTYAVQCRERHIARCSGADQHLATFALTNPSLYLSECAYSAHQAILHGHDSWERIKASVEENS